MNDQGFQIFIASNGSARPIKVSVSGSMVKVGLGLAFIALNLLVCGGIDYFGLRANRHTYQTVIDENKNLRDHRDDLERSYTTRMAELNRFRSMINKLKVITKSYSRPEDIPLPQTMASVPDTSSADGEEIEVAENSLPSAQLAAQSAASRAPSAVPAQISAPVIDKDIEIEGPLPYRLDRAGHYAHEYEQGLTALWESLTDRVALLASTPTIKPVNGYYSSPFGYRIHPITHRLLLHAGVDIAAPYGSIVRAPADGVVSYTGYEGGYGNLVSIDHGFGVTTRFAHNSKILVKEGQRIHRGDSISLAGSTGHSTGSHVHYEVHVRGFPVDPLNYILQDN